MNMWFNKKKTNLCHTEKYIHLVNFHNSSHIRPPSHKLPWGGTPHPQPCSPRPPTSRSVGWPGSGRRTPRRRGSPPPSCQKSLWCHWGASGKHLEIAMFFKRQTIIFRLRRSDGHIFSKSDLSQTIGRVVCGNRLRNLCSNPIRNGAADNLSNRWW